jgi:multidrug resistance efflux pump
MRNLQSTKSFQGIYNINKPNKISRVLIIFLITLIICLFLPWTQNIKSNGIVTTLRQEQRAQNVNTIIAGRIVKWFIKEGDYVKAGDTIAQLTEIKDDYLDPELITRTGEQLNAKKQTIEYYQGKTNAQQNQITALQNSLDIKTNQLKNKLKQQGLKIQSDSANLSAAKNDFSIANKQFIRQQELYNQGLVSLTQLEQRNQALQSIQARLINAENNLSNSRQEILITQLELNGVQQDYFEKVNKTQGEVMQAMSQIATGEGEVSKLKNQYSNYQNRNKLYFIIAPQEGQIVQAKKSGIGEIIKEGEILAQIVPKELDYAVELFIEPMDLPLISLNHKIRFIFDGFPAIVFSGWPQASYGTFGGIIVAIENSVSPNGKYRILVKEDTTDKAWPKQLRLGTGANAIALLKDVPIWYELWRNINGFPPDFYQDDKVESKSKSK